MYNIDYRKMLEKSPLGYALHKILLDDYGIPNDYEYIEVNEAFEKFTDLDKEKVIGKKVTEIFPNIKKGEFDWIKCYGDVALKNLEYEFEEYLDELNKWYKVQAYSPEKYYFITYFTDISKEIEEKELFKSILRSITEGVIATNLDGEIISINETAEKMIDIEKDELNLINIFDFLDINDDIKNDIFNTIIEGGSIKETSSVLKSRIGTKVPITYNISPAKDSIGNIYGMVISFKDVTEKIIKEQELDYATYHDSLTGAYNRNFFNEKIKEIDNEKNLPLSIIMGDVNGLKLTNDAFGHLMGDKLLKSAADIMKKVCRNQDVLVRWGGDEFIILLPETKYEDVARISERIKEECLKENIGIINISISLGYDTKKTKDEDIMKIITNAEEMMYKIKMLESKSMKNRTLKIIINTLHEKSERDQVHSTKVSEICKLIGKAIGMSQEKISELEILGEIHDIGKVAVPINILNKIRELTDEEWEEVKKHPHVGYHIVTSSSDIAFLGECVLAHHEKYDGTGYPKNLRGKEIPLMARILTIADAYEAMVNYRPYKKILTKEQAIEELKKNSGTQFDPELVHIFIDKISEKL